MKILPSIKLHSRKIFVWKMLLKESWEMYRHPVIFFCLSNSENIPMTSQKKSFFNSTHEQVNLFHIIWLLKNYFLLFLAILCAHSYSVILFIIDQDVFISLNGWFAWKFLLWKFVFAKRLQSLAFVLFLLFWYSYPA